MRLDCLLVSAAALAIGLACPLARAATQDEAQLKQQLQRLADRLRRKFPGPVRKSRDARITVLIDKILYLVDGEAAPFDARMREKRVDDRHAPRA